MIDEWNEVAKAVDEEIEVEELFGSLVLIIYDVSNRLLLVNTAFCQSHNVADHVR